MDYKVLISFIIFTILRCPLVEAQIQTGEDSSKGMEFWLAFMPNAGEMRFGTQTETSVFITADEATSIVVRIPAAGLSFDETGNAYTADYVIDIPANSSVKVIIPYEYSITNPTGNTAQGQYVSEIEDDPRGIQIESLNNAVSVYAFNTNSNTADASLIYPITALGTSHYVVTMGYDNPLAIRNATSAYEMIVVATQDNTVVDITPSGETIGGIAAGQTITVTLDKGEVYQVQSVQDLTGSKIYSHNCVPVAVFGGTSYTGIPSGYLNRDILYEQMLSTNRFGRHYVIAPYLTRRLNDTYKIVALADNTTVKIVTNGTERTFELNEGESSTEFLPIVDNVGHYIEASQPIMLAHISNSGQYDGVDDSDPFMDLVPAIEQSIDKIVFNVFEGTTIENYYITIVTHADNIDNVFLDGVSIADEFSGLIETGREEYRFARFPIEPGNHVLESSGRGFMANVYGYELRESYGYIAGAAANEVNLDFDLTWDDTRYNRLDFKDTVCFGDTLDFFALKLKGVESYTWIFNDTLIIEGDSARFYADYVGSIDIQLIGARKSECTTADDTIFKTIGISELPDVELVLTDTICPNEIPEVEYNFENGWFTFQGEEYDVFPFSELQTGDNIFEYTYINPYRCKGKARDTVHVLPMPEISIRYNSLDLHDSLDVILDAGSAYDSYLWNNGSTEQSINVHETGEYSVIVDKGGCLAYDTIVVPFIPYLSVSPNDTICKGDSASIFARTNGYLQWMEGETVVSTEALRTVSPLSETQYIVQAFFPSNKPLVSEDFENGNSSFTSDYTYKPTGDVTWAYYGLRTDPYYAGRDYYFHMSDHTSGSGKMMVVDGDTVVGSAVYEDTVSVEAGRDYAFSVWVASIRNNYINPPLLQFTIDGRPLGALDVDSLPRWTQFFTFYNAEFSGEVIIRIENINTVANGNDFVLDDIEFTEIVARLNDTVTVFVDEPFEISLGDDQRICEGGEITLNAGTADSYLWSDGSNQDELVITDHGDYSVTVSRGKCSDADTMKLALIERQTPMVQISASDTSICEGTNVRFSISDSLHLGAEPEYSWIVNGVPIGDGSFFESDKFSATTEVILEATSSEECLTTEKALDTLTIGVYERLTPLVIIKPDKDAICAGDSISYYIDGIDNEGDNPKFTWYVNGLEVGNDSIYTGVDLSSDDEVKLILESSESCLATPYAEDVEAPLVHEYPTLDLGPDLLLCQNEKGLISMPSGADYTWGDGYDLPYRYVKSPDAGDYVGSIVENGCRTFDTVNVQFTYLPNFNIIGPLAIYRGDTAFYEVSESFISYFWNDASVKPVLVTNPIDDDTFWVAVEDQYNCRDTAYISVEVFELPIIGIKDKTICEGESVTLSVEDDFDSYLWSTGAATKEIVVDEGGEYIVQATRNTIPYLTIYDTITVTEIPLPSFSVSPDQVICDGDTAIIGTAFEPFYEYKWNTGQTSNNIEVTQSGTYVLSVTAMGCTAKKGINLRVRPIPSVPITSGKTELCYYDPLPVLYASGNNIKWYADPSFSELVNEGSSFNVGQYADSIGLGDTIDFYVIANGENCNSKPKKMSVLRRKMETDFEILADSTEFCVNTYNVPFTASGYIDSLRWFQTGARVNSAYRSFLNLDFLVKGEPIIYAQTVDRFGCWYYDSLRLKVLPIPNASLSVWFDGEEGHFVNTSENADDSVSYYWFFYGSDGWVPAMSRDTVMYYDYGSAGVQLMATNEYACTNYARRDFLVKLPYTLMIPNAFAPDHLAEKVRTFKAVGMNLKIFKMWVYDVWGNTVWYTEALDENGSPAESWDGRYKGALLKPDCYTWKVYAQFVDDTVWEGVEQDGKFYDTGTVIMIR